MVASRIMELTDAHVLVTGASRGIGAAICRELHARGAKLTLVARDAQKLQELADELGGANVLPADLTDADALGTLVAHAFTALDCHRLEADIDPANAASARLLEALGFVREGHLRERWIVGDTISDSYLYGLLRHDWRR